jgi:hypothetical protein
MEHSPEEEEWYCEINMGIDEVRALYYHLCYAIETWPGAPRRPAQEQEFLQFLKMRMFAMISDYNFEYGDSANRDQSP